MLEGIAVPFDKGVNVTALSAQVSAGVLNGLISDGIWSDVTVEIKKAETQMGEQLAKVEKARKAKHKK